MKSEEQCDFCLTPILKTTKYFRNLHGNIPHVLNIPNVPANFTVLQDVVPLAENGGHLLLMPNHHFISLATVNDKKGLINTTDIIIKNLHKYFPNNPIFIFEHGAGFIEKKPIACGGCHINHAHGHIVVLPKGSKLEIIKNKMEEELIRSGWRNPRTQAIQSSRIFYHLDKFTGLNPYLHIGIVTKDGQITSFTYPQKVKSFNIPSQLIRAVISSIIYGQADSTHWHWRDILIGLTSLKRIKQIKTDVVKFRKITGF